MPIESIDVQPNTGSLNAAYRPIIFRVAARRTDLTPRPPVVYCDVYIDGIFYKTLSKTQYAAINDTHSEWVFDIQDACQEALKKELPPNGGTAIVQTTGIMRQLFCRFRSSGFDPDGFVSPEDLAPIQGTGSTAPVAGTGTDSNAFFVINAVLQHENNQSITTHLNSFKANTGNSIWALTAFPLTHRPAYYCVTVTDSDYYPFVSLATEDLIVLRIKYKHKGVGSFLEQEISISESITAGVIYVPAGPKNLKTLFPGIDWRLVDIYFIELYESSGSLLMSTCYYKNIYSPDVNTRICFLNYLGAFDCVSLRRTSIVHEAATTGQYKKSVGYPLQKSDSGIERMNVNATDTYQALTTDYSEIDMAWLQECIDSPKTYMEWKGTEGQADGYMAIVLQDGQFPKLKNNDEFSYQFAVEFKLSNDYISIRN